MERDPRTRDEGDEEAREAREDEGPAPEAGGDAPAPDASPRQKALPRQRRLEVLSGSEEGDDREAEETEFPADAEPGIGEERQREAEDLARAKGLVREGRVEEAERVYQEIIRKKPRHVKARNNLGVLYDETGAHDRAVEQFEAALTQEPENVEVLTNLGSALASQGEFEEAEGILRRAMRLESENHEVRAALGILSFRRGLYAQSEAELRWVCERAPEHGPAHYYRGEALNRMGKVEEALEALKRASQLQPRNPKVFYTLGMLFDKKHLPDQAALMYRTARELTDR
ncbi:MAG: tetratricopeptide repeat protein [Gemmatimonadetes bacterium]|nr:tetratricopeptide repeat protein [Gemmatimonadota bacterium]NIR77438.1 tetratricopeptide repeat protein [Gemmatimonadota bacterium]NIT85962.1 tetratricopeptide repeat protein [Gemmatimonadota bacterium]NIU29782.1 tetratricopeptide repeat protein [Gemmatimonadota bacterium]NIU34804.1 tetratricopeptide repeat protein [Gemmatimonadota bacterium]